MSCLESTDFWAYLGHLALEAQGPFSFCHFLLRMILCFHLKREWCAWLPGFSEAVSLARDEPPSTVWVLPLFLPCRQCQPSHLSLPAGNVSIWIRPTIFLGFCFWASIMISFSGWEAGVQQRGNRGELVLWLTGKWKFARDVVQFCGSR